MNRSDIEEAVMIRSKYPLLHQAARFLHAFMQEVDQHSDGWPYWSAPSKAAAKLMELVERKPEEYRTPRTHDISRDEYKKALTPIKSFYTRVGYKAGMKYPEVQ